MRGKLQSQKLILFSVLLLALISYPLISIANKLHMVFGVPVLFFYIFLVWFLSVLVIYAIVTNKKNNTDE